MAHSDLLRLLKVIGWRLIPTIQYLKHSVAIEMFYTGAMLLSWLVLGLLRWFTRCDRGGIGCVSVVYRL